MPSPDTVEIINPRGHLWSYYEHSYLLQNMFVELNHTIYEASFKRWNTNWLLSIGNDLVCLRKPHDCRKREKSHYKYTFGSCVLGDRNCLNDFSLNTGNLGELKLLGFLSDIERLPALLLYENTRSLVEQWSNFFFGCSMRSNWCPQIQTHPPQKKK